MSGSEKISRRDQLNALIRVASYRPRFTVAIIFGGIFSALLEGIGLGFIIPIINIIQDPNTSSEEADGILQVFISVYEFFGIPFTLEFVIVGVSLVLTVRWTTTFVVRWLRSALSVDFTRHIQTESFANTLDARIEYFDQEGSDDILNAIVTQAEYAGRSIHYVVNFVEQIFLTLMYFAVAMVISPSLTLSVVLILGVLATLFQLGVKSGYELGDKVADGNERIQKVAQAGTQGIRDVKLFGIKSELLNDFKDSVKQFAQSTIKLRRNEIAIRNFYNLVTSIVVFVLIYISIRFANLSIGSMGAFLFAMFRLGPKASALNSKYYQIETNLPHLVRAQSFADELDRRSEPTASSISVPEEIEHVEYRNVDFRYTGQENLVLSDISFSAQKGEYIGFVGQSGAGKSTITALLARMYEPDSGEILANGEPIQEMDIESWRSKVAIVQQDPYIFDETLRYNITIGNRDVSETEFESAIRIANIDEFYDELPEGYETELGDDGVRLSGGQRQRVALARALLKDADILILDEATSDLDSNLEREVQRSIEAMDHEYIMIGIAHQLSTVENADRIYTVEGGEIVEVGDHQELIERGGKYSQLYNIQTGE